MDKEIGRVKALPGPSEITVVDEKPSHTTETFKVAEIPALRNLYQYAIKHLEEENEIVLPEKEELLVLARRLLQTILDHETEMARRNND